MMPSWSGATSLAGNRGAVSGIGKSQPPAFPEALQEADEFAARIFQEAVPVARIMHDIGAVKGRAQHGCVSHLPAIAAANATLIDMRDRIVAERIVERLHRQRRAAG